jgi:hypothetical protein
MVIIGSRKKIKDIEIGVNKNPFYSCQFLRVLYTKINAQGSRVITIA